MYFHSLLKDTFLLIYYAVASESRNTLERFPLLKKPKEDSYRGVPSKSNSGYLRTVRTLQIMSGWSVVQ